MLRFSLLRLPTQSYLCQLVLDKSLSSTSTILLSISPSPKTVETSTRSVASLIKQSRCVIIRLASPSLSDCRQTWRILYHCDLAGLEREFIDNFESQNVLFDASRTFNEVVYGKRKLHPSLWTTSPLRKPKIIDFLMETTDKIRVQNADKKFQSKVQFPFPRAQVIS
jgi:hypothetical protein